MSLDSRRARRAPIPEEVGQGRVTAKAREEGGEGAFQGVGGEGLLTGQGEGFRRQWEGQRRRRRLG